MRKIEELDFQNISDKERAIEIFRNGVDFIEAKLGSWLAERTPETIEITNSHQKRKFIHANYCKNLDRIEIHCIDGIDFETVTLKIDKSKHCVLECCQFVIVSYKDEEEAKKLIKCKRKKFTNPGHSKGSIIVSNP